ncbi:MAG TPA: DUF4166 domain-containing protein [Rhizomicrobium sp.]|jgi:hypothetical protein
MALALPRFEDPPDIQHDASLLDLRFASLLPLAEWNALPAPIRQRFSKRLAGGRTAVYVGGVVETKLTWVGRLFGFLARLIGGPLPTSSDPGPAVVSVTEDAGSGGQIWTRLYARRSGFPQIIHSAKSFAGPTGLEETVGHGVGMALRLEVREGALLFHSAGYYLRIGGLRVPLPGWIAPGAITVTHREAGEGRFQFVLDVDHPRFGRIIQQTAIFREAKL